MGPSSEINIKWNFIFHSIYVYLWRRAYTWNVKLRFPFIGSLQTFYISIFISTLRLLIYIESFDLRRFYEIIIKRRPEYKFRREVKSAGGTNQDGVKNGVLMANISGTRIAKMTCFHASWTSRRFTILCLKCLWNEN